MDSGGRHVMVWRMMKFMPSPIRRAIHHIGRRGLFLLFWAFLWTTTGYRWTKMPPQSDSYSVLFNIAPPHVWGYVFIAMAGLMAGGAFLKKYDPAAFGISTYVAFFVGTMVLFSVPDAAGITVAMTYYLYAFFILVVSGWPEAPSKE